MLRVSVQRHTYRETNKNRNSLLIQTGVDFFPLEHPDITKRDFIQGTTKTRKDRGEASWTALVTHATWETTSGLNRQVVLLLRTFKGKGQTRPTIHAQASAEVDPTLISINSQESRPWLHPQTTEEGEQKRPLPSHQRSRSSACWSWGSGCKRT